MSNFDQGPPAPFASIFASVPDPPVKADFWFDWGPVFYRGRLDGAAKVLCIASDPGPTERIGGRNLIGNAGQRVQGFLAKLGITSSYVLLNAWAYALHPSSALEAQSYLDDPSQLAWRNKLYEAVAALKQPQAVIAFGVMAQKAVALWDTKPNVEVTKVPHPSSRNEKVLLDAWRAAITKLRTVVTVDQGGTNGGNNYGSSFNETDYARVPSFDLPFGVPAFLGDDAWVRKGSGMNSVSRPSPDDDHTLVWRAPTSS